MPLACPKCLAEGLSEKEAAANAFRVYSQVPKPRADGKKGTLSTSVTLDAVFCGSAGLRDGKGTLTPRGKQHGLVAVEHGALVKARRAPAGSAKAKPAKAKPRKAAKKAAGKARKATAAPTPAATGENPSAGSGGVATTPLPPAPAAPMATAGPEAPPDGAEAPPA